MIALPLEIAPRIVGDNPIRRPQITRLRAGYRLDRLRPAIHVTEHPLLASFPLRTAQFDVAIRMIFQFIPVLDEPVRCVVKPNANSNLWGLPAPRSWVEEATSFAGVEVKRPPVEGEPLSE